MKKYKVFKLLVAFAFSIVLVFAMSACSSQDQEQADDSTEAVVAEESEADASDLEQMPNIKEDVAVAAVFAGVEAQELLTDEESLEPVSANTLWIYYEDNTFDQYAKLGDTYKFYSSGTYSFKDDADFIIEGDDEGTIVIERARLLSLNERKVVENASSEEFALGTFKCRQLFGPSDKKEVEAIFGDANYVPYADKDGTISKLDAFYLYFTDGSFSEYAFLDDDVVLFGSGTYKFDEAGDFHVGPYEEDSGSISLTWEESMSGLDGQTTTFDLASTGLQSFYEQKDESMPDLPTEPPKI